jgi:hypothetical protein
LHFGHTFLACRRGLAMSQSKKPSRSRISLAAALRAAGESWEQIGQAVGRSAERVRHWPKRYTEEWGGAFRAAESHLMADVATEAKHHLRALMRSKAESIQLNAVLGALKLRHLEREREYRIDAAAAAAKPEIDPDLLAFIEHVRTANDEELKALNGQLKDQESEMIEERTTESQRTQREENTERIRNSI